MREQQGLESIQHADSLFADDVTAPKIGPEFPLEEKEAVDKAANVTKVLGDESPSVQVPKTRNILLDPRFLPRGVYRRALPVSTMTSRTRLHAQFATEAPISTTMLDFGPLAHPLLPVRASLEEGGFPYPLEDQMRILGVTFDNHFVLDAHVRAMLARDQVRQGILARVAPSSCGFGRSILRITHDALATSLLRYDLVVTSSCYQGRLAVKLDAAVIDTASRRILGLPLRTRVEVLRFLAGPFALRNLYLRHCATFVHRALIGHDNRLQGKLRRELAAVCRVPRLDLVDRELPVEIAAGFAMDSPEGPLRAISRTKWMRCVYDVPPPLDGIRPPENLYHARAAEIRGFVTQTRRTYTLGFAHSWLDVGF